MTITRRQLLAGAAGSVAALAGAKTEAVPGATQPSIVMIVTDDMRADEWEALPRTRALRAGAGTTFPNFFLTTPQCGPSRASILTGRYAHSTGILGNGDAYKKFRDLGLEANTVAVWLQQAGYRTALVGKSINGHQNRRYGGHGVVPPGWTDWHSMMNVPTAYYRFSVSDNGVETSFEKKDGAYGTDVFTERALAVIADTEPQQPLFLMLNVSAPHGPSKPAPRHSELFPDAVVPRTDAFNEADVSDKPRDIRELAPFTPERIAEIDAERRGRLQSLQAVDEAVERIVELLEQEGRLESTVILFLSDNGYLLGEHRAWAKSVAYEESARVPLVVRGPGFSAGVVREEMVANIDLAPTLAAIAGIDVPEIVDGRPLPMTNTDPGPPRQAVLIQYLQYPGGVGRYRALRTPTLLYVEYFTGERELYDLARDPLQLTNLAGNPAAGETISALSAHLAALADCGGATCRAAEDEPLTLPRWPV
jgi:N-acetylglucosamine-6-sulfatase